MSTGRIHIGTSGWHYRHWVGPFYPEGTASADFLAFYAQRFHTVEINNTFYSLPRKSTLEAWRDGTPPDFLFACKASRFITHMKKLGDPVRSIQRFFDTIATLGPKLGPVLFQLPPRWHVDEGRLRAFLSSLPAGHRYAFELRDETWFTDGVLDALAGARAACCIYDLDGRRSPVCLTADLVYVRLHGPARAYRGRYSGASLRAWADKLITWRDEGRTVFCYFDNDEGGYAAFDAGRLSALVDRGRSGARRRPPVRRRRRSSPSARNAAGSRG